MSLPSNPLVNVVNVHGTINNDANSGIRFPAFEVGANDTGQDL